MKTSALKIFILVFASVFAPAFAFAVPASHITVQFEQTPLFSKTNFAPGETETRFFRVTNNTTSEKEAVIETVNYSACPILPFSPCFAKKLDVKIFSGSNIYFGEETKTLSDLFGAGEVSLGKLSAGATKEYKMSVQFSAGEDDNDYQTRSTGFDLLVGFRGEEGQGGGGGSGGNGGGGGGVVLPPGLQIQNEATIVDSDNSILVSWATNYNSYGHLIYGIDTGAPYVLDLSSSNFGYPFSAPSDPSVFGHTDTAQSLNHSIVLSGLAPGTYRYRVVSHASPPTVGYERTFTVPGVPKKVAVTENEIALGEVQNNQSGQIGLVAGASDEITEQESDGTDGTREQWNNGTTKERRNKNSKSSTTNVAAAATSFPSVSFLVLFCLGILALFLGYFLAKKMKK